jgi:HK97 family phage portal protein
MNRRDVIHVASLSRDGILGMSPLEHARTAMRTGIALDTYAANVLENGAFPAGVLTHPGRLSDEQRISLRDTWTRMMTGVANAGRPALLEGGVTYQPVTLNPADLQFLEQRAFSATMIARIFRVPPHMIGAASGDSQTYTNVEAESLKFVTYTLRPWLVAIEQAVTADPDLMDAPGLYAEFLTDAILRTDTLTRYQAYALAGSFLTVNELRRLENLPEIAGGDVLAGSLTPGATDPTGTNSTNGVAA